jgi:hypothetical protein
LGASVTVIDMLTSMPVLAFPIVGALLASRRPRNPIGWICLADGLLWTFLGMIGTYGIYGLARPGSVAFPVAVYALGEWLWVPAVTLLAIYLILLFPDGRLPSRRWRPLVWLSGVAILLGRAASRLSPGPIADLGGVRNPYGLEGQPWVADTANAILVVFLVCILASVLSLILRYRRSLGERRQQIKWIAFAASFVGFGFVSAMASGLIVLAFAPESWGSANTPPLWFDLLFSVVLVSFGGVPIAVGVAVLRSRLYDIDLLINRALVYGSLTVLLSATYFGGVVGLQAVVRSLTGQGSTLAVVASVDLLLDHRFGWLSRGYGVCVPMHYLPGAVFRSKDHRSPQSPWGSLLSPADLGLALLYLHYVSKLRSHILRHDLIAGDLAISERRCGTLHDLSNLLPSMRGRGEGVVEGYVFLMGEDLLHRLRVSFCELLLR